jgi:hypothetical protein
MNFNTDHSEQIFYCTSSDSCNDSLDCDFSYNAELCYECIDSYQVYNCRYSQNINNSSECYFSTDLKGCTRCFGCSGLRNKELHIFNEPVSEEQWNRLVNKRSWDYEYIEQNKRKAKELSSNLPKKHTQQVNCENCFGDYLINCKNVVESYDATNAEELKYVIYSPFNAKHVQDAYAVGDDSWAYEILGGAGATNVAFINNPVNGPSFSYYCTQCVNGTKNCFGCVALKKSEYCIFNKQYSEEDYNHLVPKIIEHMQSTGEWGEFFPTTISPFAYNETIAQREYPIAKEEALSKGWKWKDEVSEKPNVEKIIPASRLPNTIDKVPDDILNWAIECEETGRLFRIVPLELSLYRKLKIPIPKFHPEVRHSKRFSQRRPHKLFSRTCQNCQKNIQTSYSPNRPEKILCEQCYQAEVY